MRKLVAFIVFAAIAGTYVVHKLESDAKASVTNAVQVHKRMLEDL